MFSNNTTNNSCQLHHLLNPTCIGAEQGIAPQPTSQPTPAPVPPVHNATNVSGAAPVQTTNATQQAVAAQKARLQELGLKPNHLKNFKNRINAYTHSRQHTHSRKFKHIQDAVNNLTGLSPEARTYANGLLQQRRTEITAGGKGLTVVKCTGGEYDGVLVDVVAFEIGKRGVAAVKAGVCGRMGGSAAVGGDGSSGYRQARQAQSTGSTTAPITGSTADSPIALPAQQKPPAQQQQAQPELQSPLQPPAQQQFQQSQQVESQAQMLQQQQHIAALEADLVRRTEKENKILTQQNKLLTEHVLLHKNYEEVKQQNNVLSEENAALKLLKNEPHNNTMQQR